MPTKQIKMQFQIASDDDVSTNVTVVNNGQQVFSGPLAQTTTAIVPFDVRNDTVPYQEITFDVDVPQFSNTIPLENQFTNITSIISCSGGNIAIQDTLANYSIVEITQAGNTNYIGNADTYVILNIPESPLFDGNVDNSLYDISKNYGITGPGAVIISQPTVVTVVHAVTPYYLSN
jgi:hypothetical protein